MNNDVLVERVRNTSTERKKKIRDPAGIEPKINKLARRLDLGSLETLGPLVVHRDLGFLNCLDPRLGLSV